MSKYIKILNLMMCAIAPFFEGAMAQTANACRTLAELQSGEKSLNFYGYGQGSDEETASHRALVDLASSIRQQITSSSTVREANDNADFSSITSSAVSETLINAKKSLPCKAEDGYIVTASMQKEDFFVGLESKLASTLSKAKNYLSKIEKPKDKVSQAINVENARKFLEKTQDSFDSDFDVCRTYNRCKKISGSQILDDLKVAIADKLSNEEYFLDTKGGVEKNLRRSLSDLLVDAGYEISSDEKDSSDLAKKIRSACSVSVGGRLLNGYDHVGQVSCILTGYIGSQKVFTKKYSCKKIITEEVEDSSDDHLARKKTPKRESREKLKEKTLDECRDGLEEKQP